MDTTNENDDKRDAAETSETTPLDSAHSSREISHNRAAEVLSSRPFGLFISAFVGAAITAGTTCALVLHVQHLVAKASVSSDPSVWIRTARTDGYDRCYNGCIKCNDPSYAYNACAKTAKVNVTGVICDGNRMWNWKDRYPTECLQALGEIFKKEALSAKKNGYKAQYAIVIVTVLGGVLGGFLVYKLWKWAAARAESRKWQHQRQAAEFDQGSSGMPTKNSYKLPKGPKFLLLSFLALFGKAPVAKAYSCTGYDATHHQYFTNSNKTIFGIVEGWYSNCYDVQHCDQKCTSKCSDGSCKKSCKKVCHTVTYSDKSPKDYVQGIMSSVTACGFEATDGVSGDPEMRIANGGIERNWWVQMRVNGYNITKESDTDESIWCLYDIGN